MRCAKSFALILLVSVMATSAHAGGGKLGLFQCGLQLGGATKVHKAYSAPNKNKGHAARQVIKSIESKGPAVTNFTPVTSKHNGRMRMPPAFTLAKVGCSWR